MKFEQGYWQLLPNTEAIFPLSVVDVRVDGDALEVTGYSHKIDNRNDYLHGSIITARFSAPLPDVIRVQLTHFKGRRPQQPEFDLDYALTNPDAEIGMDETTAWLRSGGLSVVVPAHGRWGIEFRRGDELVTSSGREATALMTQNGVAYVREQLELEPGETVYGLGERFGPLTKNGQSFDSWNADGGTSSELAYKNAPFYMSNRGYGVLVNHPGRVSWEVASHQVERVQFSVEGHSLDYYVFGGPTMKDALTQYSALSGRPPLLPEWSFGLWLSTSFTTNYDEASIWANIDRMEALGIPVSVFHFDCFWMRELTWCSFLWDERCFPDPAGLIARIKARGIKVCAWINPYIAEKSPLFAEGMANDYLLKTPDGDVYQVDDWQPGMGLVDFSNPAACDWYAGKLRGLLDIGVDCFKTDFGERIPTNVVYHSGADPERMHNYYTYLYNGTVFNLLREVKGEGEAILFARSGTVGSQQHPVHWGGDNTSSYPSMAETLRGGLSLGLTGFGFWSHDISGFNKTATPDLYKRWVAFGLLSSHSRLHGNETARFPWLFDDEAPDVLRFFTNLKLRLMPYVLDVAREAHEHGWPWMRAMVLEFPDDPTCQYLDMQYMIGPALLVAPVFRADGQTRVYLPAGAWRHLLTGEVAQGPGWRSDRHDYFSLPLWVNVERGAGWDCLQPANEG